MYLRGLLSLVIHSGIKKSVIVPAATWHRG
jgi:hypothetical protein